MNPTTNNVARRRRFVAVFMESPLYFTLTLRERLEFLKCQEEQSLRRGLLNDLWGNQAAPHWE